jgi:hypothetical protein
VPLLAVVEGFVSGKIERLYLKVESLLPEM